MKRALITGGTGFIGSHLVATLRRQGWQVICMVRRRVQSRDEDIQCVHGDMARPQELNLEVGAIDAVFHLGATLPVPDKSPHDYLIQNAQATMQLLQLAGKCPFIYMSSMSVVGRPVTLPVTEEHATQPENFYGWSKFCGEAACELMRRTRQLPVTSLRITSPYGAGMATTTVLPRFVHQATTAEGIRWFGKGARTQNFIHVNDIVRACLLAAETTQHGVYNIAGEKAVSMRELAELVARLIPGGRAEPSGTQDSQEDWRWDVDGTRAERLLGFRPEIGLEQGLKDYIHNPASPRWWAV